MSKVAKLQESDSVLQENDAARVGAEQRGVRKRVLLKPRDRLLLSGPNRSEHVLQQSRGEGSDRRQQQLA